MAPSKVESTNEQASMGVCRLGDKPPRLEPYSVDRGALCMSVLTLCETKRTELTRVWVAGRVQEGTISARREEAI